MTEVVSSGGVHDNNVQEQEQSLLVDVSVAKGQGHGESHVDEGVVVSPPSAPVMNNYMNGLSNGLAGEHPTGSDGQDRGLKAMTSPPDTADTGYAEFDPLSAQLSNERSLEEEFAVTGDNRGAAVLIDLEASNSASSTSSNDIQNASTASVSPPSPPGAERRERAPEMEPEGGVMKENRDPAAPESPSGERPDNDEERPGVVASDVAVEQLEDHVTGVGQSEEAEADERGAAEKHVTFHQTDAMETVAEEADSPKRAVLRSPPPSPTKIPEPLKKTQSPRSAAPSQPPAKPPRVRNAATARRPAESPKTSVTSPKGEKPNAEKDGASEAAVVAAEEDKATKKSTAEKKVAEIRSRSQHKSSRTTPQRSASTAAPTPSRSAGTPATTRSGSATRVTARSKVRSLENATHKPGGGNVKILHKTVDVSNVQSKCGSKDNIKHTPKGGDKKIESRKLDFSKVESRCGSKANIKHTPGGGAKKIESQKLEWKVQSKVGSLENASHKPRGGDKKIESHKLDFKEKAQPKVGSKNNIQHKAGGGEKKIENRKLDFKEKAAPKIGSKESPEQKNEEKNEEKNAEDVASESREKAKSRREDEANGNQTKTDLTETPEAAAAVGTA